MMLMTVEMIMVFMMIILMTKITKKYTRAMCEKIEKYHDIQIENYYFYEVVLGGKKGPTNSDRGSPPPLS